MCCLKTLVCGWPAAASLLPRTPSREMLHLFPHCLPRNCTAICASLERTLSSLRWLLVEGFRDSSFLGKAFLKIQLFPSDSPPAFDILELQKNKISQKNLIFSFGSTKPRGRVRVGRASFQAPRQEVTKVAAYKAPFGGQDPALKWKQLSLQQNVLPAEGSAQEPDPWHHRMTG